MRRGLSAMLATIICVLFLTSCDSTNENQLCEHKWERTDDYNEYTAVDKCSLCGITRTYTAPDHILDSGYETGILLSPNCDRNRMCEHRWKRTEKSNEYTVVDKCSLCGVTRTYTNPDTIFDSGNEEGFKMLRYVHYFFIGDGINQKEIYASDLGYAIIDCLSKLEETGEVIPKISDDVVDKVLCELPVEKGTLWIECGSVGMFRINPEKTEICKVQTHLGEGKSLQMTDTLKKLLTQAWLYHPYDYWSGAYKNGAVSLQPIYSSDSAVEWVEIESIYIENKRHSHNKITLRIRANENTIVNAHIEAYQSDHVYSHWEDREIRLLSGDEVTVEFTFAGFYNYSYWLSITIDNTKIDLAITPVNTK